MTLGRHLSYDGQKYECTLCCRDFATKESLYAHCRNTSRHEWCEKCLRVFPSFGAKDAHLRSSPRHNHICVRCRYRPIFIDSQELRDHDIEWHNLCHICGRYFANENNLRMHQQCHQPRQLECFGCYNTFKTFSGMLIHLESGSCSSGTDDDDIYRLACICYQSRKYISYGNYKCPGCDKYFSTLSALYQHVEDAILCSHFTDPGQCLAKLEYFISWNV